MTNKFLGSLLLSALMVSLIVNLSGCGGGSAASAPSAEPIAAQPLEVGTPVITPNPPAVTQPAPTVPVAPAVPVTPAPVTPAPVTPAAPSGAITSANSCSLANFQTDLMRAINVARTQSRSCGTEAKSAVAALSWSDSLFAAAAAHSQDMAQRNYFSHTSPEGKSAGDRMLLAGYRFSAWGENIAAGQPSINVVMAGWLASDGHCRNIMNAAFTDVAVACVATSRPMYPTYWTMVLGKPQ